MYVKYPRTRHLPWSLGTTNDDVKLKDLSHFNGREVVVTEKMDGENTSMYSDHIHARSIDSKHHPSRNWVKALHASVAHNIPEGWRVCGENLYARHSVSYDDLSTYFMVFSIWDEHNMALSWDETVEYTDLLGLEPVPVLWRGEWDEKIIRSLEVDTETSEGYVVRVTDSFSYDEFGVSLAKWVRENHVQTDTHWMHQQVVPNGLKED